MKCLKAIGHSLRLKKRIFFNFFYNFMHEYCICIISTPFSPQLFLCPSPHSLSNPWLLLIFAYVYIHDLLSPFRAAHMYKSLGRPLGTGWPIMELLPGEDQFSISLRPPIVLHLGVGPCEIPPPLACWLLSLCRSCWDVLGVASLSRLEDTA